MKAFLKRLLVGDNEVREYPPIRIPGDIPEKVYLEMAGTMTHVSQNHWLLCIEPVIFGIWIKQDEREVSYERQEQYHLYFFDSADNARNKKKASAIVTLSFCDCIKEKNGMLLLLKVIKSNIYHLDFLRRYVLFSRCYKKNGLTFSKFKSFTAAYSYPRRIRLISFKQDDYYNIFPMDLLGNVNGSKRFVFGLRHTNVSLSRIIETGKLVVSEVSFNHKNTILELGKHHSSKPPSLDSLTFDLVPSKNFGFYLPDWINSYKEIKILETKNLGSHMLLWGEVLQENTLSEAGDNLFLIHFFEYLHQKNNGSAYLLA